jgi:hypothetical protein
MYHWSPLVSLRSLATHPAQPNPDALRVAIRETKKLTSHPFGVNITILPSITPPDYAGFAKAAVEEGVRIFETAGNNPGPLIKYLKSEGESRSLRQRQAARRPEAD